MFDDFDLRVNVEETRGYEEEEAFAAWYQEDFSDYCDYCEKTQKYSFSGNNSDYFDYFDEF